MPRAGGEGAAAVVAAAALAEVAALPEQVAVVGVAEGRGLEERGGAGAGGIDEDVEDEGVLVDLGAAAVGGDAVGHDVADVAVEGAGDLHDLGVAAVDGGKTQGGGGAEDGAGLGDAVVAVEVGEGGADGGAEVAGIEVPLACDARAGSAGDDDAEVPGGGAGLGDGVGVGEGDRVVGGGAARVGIVLEADLVAALGQGLRGHRGAVEGQRHAARGDGAGAVNDDGGDGRGGLVAVGAGRGGDLGDVGAGGLDVGVGAEDAEAARVAGVIQEDARGVAGDGVPLEGGPAAVLPVHEAHGIEARGRDVDGPLVLVAAVSLERRGEALELADLDPEEVARVGRGRHDVGVVVVHVGAVRGHGDAEGRLADGQLDPSHDLDGEEVRGAAVAGDAGEVAGGEGREVVAFDVREVKGDGVALEVDGVHVGQAAGLGPRDRVVGDGVAGCVHEGAVELPDGAQVGVADLGVRRGLDDPHGEAAGG